MFSFFILELDYSRIQNSSRKMNGGGGGGVLSFFSSYVGSGPASTLHPPKNIRNFKHQKKVFEILATPENIHHVTPKYSPIL